ncbi:aldehyde dehydrogenase family protein [Streptomyces antimycoticus]
MSELLVLRNHIDGAYTDAADGRRLEVTDPVTGEVYASSPLSGAADVDAAMAAAAAAFPVWRDATPSTRQKLLLRIADAVEARAEEIADAECRNTGKPRALTLTEEIAPIVDQIRFFAGAARLLEGRSAGEYMEGLTSIIRREPIGVCAQVAPWNYPLMMGVWKFAPALAAGNTVVLKPSDTTPASTVLLAGIIGDILKEMGLPAGIFNVVCGDRETGRLMVEHPTPAMAAITGSVRAGMQVAASASKDIKRVHLELGGKAPAVVFEDADIAEAVEGISLAGFFNAGLVGQALCRSAPSARPARGAVGAGCGEPGAMEDKTPAPARVVVDEPLDGRRRVLIDGQDVGVVVSADELRRLLQRAGVLEENATLDNPELIEWNGGGPGDWPAAPR